MALTDVRSYFRTRMNSLGFTEHKDGFASDNIPSTLLNKAYFMDMGRAQSVGLNHHAQEIEMGLTLRVFYKGYLDPAGAIDDAILGAECILLDVLDVDNRLGVEIKNVTFSGMTVEPQSASNDNNAVLEMDFNAKVFLTINSNQ